MASSPWTCTRCGAVNTSTATSCVTCGQARELDAGTTPPAASQGAWSPPAVPEQPGSGAGMGAGGADTGGPAAEWAAPTAGEAGPAPVGDAGTPTAGQAGPDAGPGALPGWWQPGTPAPETPPGTGSRALRILRPVGIVAVIAVVAIGAWWFSAKRDDSGAITDAGDLSSFELRVGDCFDLKDAAAELVADVTAKPCTETHEYEVYLVEDMPAGDFPSQATIDAYAADSCLPAFESFIGLAYEQSELEIYYLAPSEDSWRNGDRAVMCAVYHPRIDELTGSLKGSAR